MYSVLIPKDQGICIVITHIVDHFFTCDSHHKVDSTGWGSY